MSCVRLNPKITTFSKSSVSLAADSGTWIGSFSNGLLIGSRMSGSGSADVIVTQTADGTIWMRNVSPYARTISITCYLLAI